MKNTYTFIQFEICLFILRKCSAQLQRKCVCVVVLVIIVWFLMLSNMRRHTIRKTVHIRV